MKHLKKFNEEKSYDIVNKSDLDIAGNWSSDYHWHVKAGRKPYTKKGFLLTPVEDKTPVLGRKKTIPHKGVVFLTEEEANKINQLGSQIENKIKLYDELFDSIIYSHHDKHYKSDDNLKNRSSGVSLKDDGSGEVRTSGFNESYKVVEDDYNYFKSLIEEEGITDPDVLLMTAKHHWVLGDGKSSDFPREEYKKIINELLG